MPTQLLVSTVYSCLAMNKIQIVYSDMAQNESTGWLCITPFPTLYTVHIVVSALTHVPNQLDSFINLPDPPQVIIAPVRRMCKGRER